MLWGILGKKKTDVPAPPPAPGTRQIISDMPAITSRAEEAPTQLETYETHDEPPELPEFPTTEEHAELPELPQYQSEPQEVMQVAPVRNIRQEMPRFETPDKKSSFISMDEYEEIATQANAIREKLKESERMVRELAEVRTEEEKTFEKWRLLLENLEKKLSYVDTLIEQGEAV